MLRPAIVVHGGAGDRPRGGPEVTAGRAGCEAVVRFAAARLAAGDSALDVVEAAVRMLEDDPQFNAGVGSCLTREGTVEMDAAIMSGLSLHLGAVAAVSGVRNPIALARRVLEDGEHALLVGAGALAFAREVGIDLVPPDFHITERSRQQLAAELERRRKQPPRPGGGTVGAVAVDRDGHVAAATSTGGLIAKRVGRVGDSALPGAGTYADDLAGAASATGHGERIMEVVLAKAAIDALRDGAAPSEVAAAVVKDMHARTGGKGGIILVDPQGRTGAAWTTTSMSWASG